MFQGINSTNTKDRSYVKISNEELLSKIHSTSISSREHRYLQARALYSGLAKKSMHEYQKIQNKSQDNAFANMYCAVASIIYSEDLRMKSMQNPKKLPNGLYQGHAYTQRQLGEEYRLVKLENTCLEKALAINPELAQANYEYGYFLYYSQSERKRGIEFIEKGISFDPNDPKGHRLLGLIMYFKGLPDYNPKRAERELKTAIGLDSTYAIPHFLLANLYFDLKRSVDAKHEIKEYLARMPDDTEKTPEIVRILQG
jgi:tetratricopeptide (TPR) repeat protein